MTAVATEVHRRPDGKRLFNPPRHPGFQTIAHTILTVISLGLLAMVLWRDRGPIRELAVRRPDLRMLAFALLLTQVNLFLVFGRWAILVRILDRRIKELRNLTAGAGDLPPSHPRSSPSPKRKRIRDQKSRGHRAQFSEVRYRVPRTRDQAPA